MHIAQCEKISIGHFFIKICERSELWFTFFRHFYSFFLTRYLTVNQNQAQFCREKRDKISHRAQCIYVPARLELNSRPTIFLKVLNALLKVFLELDQA